MHDAAGYINSSLQLPRQDVCVGVCVWECLPLVGQHIVQKQSNVVTSCFVFASDDPHWLTCSYNIIHVLGVAKQYRYMTSPNASRLVGQMIFAWHLGLTWHLNVGLSGYELCISMHSESMRI